MKLSGAVVAITTIGATHGTCGDRTGGLSPAICCDEHGGETGRSTDVRAAAR